MMKSEFNDGGVLAGRNFDIMLNDISDVCKRSKFKDITDPWNQSDTNYQMCLLLRQAKSLIDLQSDQIIWLKNEIEQIKTFLNID